MLELYRRHSDKCPHQAKGQGYTKCSCPIWCYGELDGKPVRQSLKLRDWSRAVRRADQWEKEPKKAIAVLRLSSAIKSYLADCGARNLAHSTIASYRKTLEHLQAFRGDVGMEEIDLAFLSDFRTSREVKASTSGKELETLRAFCAYCVDRQWLLKNYAQKLKAPKDDGMPTMPYTPEEVEKILAACDEIASGNPAETPLVRARAKAECLMLLYSGMRISDVVKLERRTVDLETGALLLRIQKTGVKQYIRIHADATAALAALPDRGEYFFWSGRGDLITAVKNARRTIQRVLAIAGVDGHPHRFRDTFSVSLLDAGEDLRTVQLLLGHASIRTTEKHYAPYVKSFQRILDAATAKLDFSGKKICTEMRTEGNKRDKLNKVG